MPTKEKEKGNLVEDVVALLHETPGVNVERRVKLPSLIDGPKRRREIDVLLTGDLAGYPVRIAIECKNEAKPVGTGRIDEFTGKLKDVGIPPSYGIFVSPVGYTADALARARSAGIRPLLLDGLTPDRLAVEVNDAFQSIVFLTATWRTLSRFDNVGELPLPRIVLRTSLDRALGDGIPALLTHLWLLWVKDRIPPCIGLHHIFISLPEGFRHSRNESPLRAGHVIAVLEVVGEVASFPGKARRLGLRDAGTSQVERLRVEAEFDRPPQKMPLDRFATELALTEYLNSHAVNLAQRIRVPRIASEWTYWPPTRAAIERIQQLKAAGEEITFEKVEGTSLSAAWSFPRGPKDA